MLQQRNFLTGQSNTKDMKSSNFFGHESHEHQIECSKQRKFSKSCNRQSKSKSLSEIMLGTGMRNSSAVSGDKPISKAVLSQNLIKNLNYFDLIDKHGSSKNMSSKQLIIDSVKKVLSLDSDNQNQLTTSQLKPSMDALHHQDHNMQVNNSIYQLSEKSNRLNSNQSAGSRQIKKSKSSRRRSSSNEYGQNEERVLMDQTF